MNRPNTLFMNSLRIYSLGIKECSWFLNISTLGLHCKFGVRHLFLQRLSKNLKLISSEKLNFKPGSLQVHEQNVHPRPLTLLYPWMMAKETHALKYAHFYTDRGIDVLKVRTSPFDVLRPIKGSQVIAAEVLKFLLENPIFNPILVHGFSGGAYAFCECLVQVEKDTEMYGNILKRFVGQIWDSGVDVDGIPKGIPRALTDNKVLQKSIEKYLRLFLKVNYEEATIHYENSSRKMHQNRLGVPGLFIFSKTDPLSSPELNAAMYEEWEARGTPVFAKCFESSPHVSHFHRYRTDYEEEVSAFLETVGMVQPNKGRAVVF